MRYDLDPLFCQLSASAPDAGKKLIVESERICRRDVQGALKEGLVGEFENARSAACLWPLAGRAAAGGDAEVLVGARRTQLEVLVRELR